MVKPHDFVVPLRDIDRDDSPSVGAKNANLGEMIQNKFPVPPGFALTSYAYTEFLKQNQLDSKIESLLSTINFGNDESLNQVSKSIKKLVQAAKVPDEIVAAIFSEYEKLGKNEFVAIRSSAIGEDSKEASFAGQNESYLDIRGEAAVVDKVREAWSSLFAPRSIFYRHERKVSQTKAKISLVVQKMVQSDASGVIFTQDPITGDKGKVTVEAIFGLGEFIVQGKVTPDHFEVDKATFQITAKQVATQQMALIKRGGEDHEEKLSVKAGSKQKIKDFEVVALAKIAMAIEAHYYFPQDIEWAKEGDKLYIVQTRPITTTGDSTKTELVIKTKGTPILIGIR